MTSEYRLALQAEDASGRIAVAVTDYASDNIVFSKYDDDAGYSGPTHCRLRSFEGLEFPWTFKIQMCRTTGKTCVLQFSKLNTFKNNFVV